MNKTFKRITVLVAAVFMIIGLGTATYAMSLWIGSPTVEEINEKLDLIEEKSVTKSTILSEKDKTILELQKENEALKSELKEQDKTIEDNHEYMRIYYNDNERLQKEVLRLTDIIKGLEEKNDVSQALKDVEAINERLDEILKQ